MSLTASNPEILKTKQHFAILDGLRGIAAISVVIFHFMEMVYLPDKNFISHGFLAVDFFFCLSGFVIAYAYAYDDRLAKMGILAFFKSRIIRLHPLVVLGAVLGLIAFLFDPFSIAAAGYSAGKVFLLFITSLFLIPFPAMEERAFNNFGLNAPAWSLFWEYVANIAYAFVLVKFGRKSLSLLAIFAAVALAYITYRAGTIGGGWDGSSFWAGGARIAYSFLAGMLIYRFKLIFKSNIGFVGLSVLLILCFIMPSSWGIWGELAAVLIYFPLIVSLGAGASVSAGLKKYCDFAGAISYPLYMTHYFVIWSFLNFYTAYKPGVGNLVLIIVIGTVMLLGFAYLAMKFYDIPVRKYLTAKRKK